MFGNDRDSMRRFFAATWQRAQSGAELEPMERLVAGVIREHPEYQALLVPGNESALARDYTPEEGQTNPFLHMGMHIALREQAAADRPPGMLALSEQLAEHMGDRHEAEHRLMEPLGEAMWEAQRAGREPDQARYVDAVRRLVRDSTGRAPRG